MRLGLVIAFTVASCGCTSPYTSPPLSSDHPANAESPEASAWQRSRTLDLSSVEPVGSHPQVTDARNDDHSGHTTAPAATVPQDTTAAYSCPMHPEVTSDKADARCPKCGMKLVKKSETEGGN